MTPTFRLELAYTGAAYTDPAHTGIAQGGLVAGVDEAGCGPWAGPVVAGAAILDATSIPAFLHDTLNDSKKLSAPKRALLYDVLISQEGISCWTSHGIASVEEIDLLNIRQAAKLAMTRAVDGLALKPAFLLVDGTQITANGIPAQAIIKGDQQSYSIAAASIIAKVTRDRLMAGLAQTYPHYGWEKNAGYGTKAHQLGLKTHGITPHHRKSFAPIKNLLAA